MYKATLTALTSLFLLVGCKGKTPVLGIEDNQLTQCPSTPNCVNSQAEDKEYYIEPILVTGTQLEIKEHLLRILKEFKRSKITVVNNDYIRSEFTSKLFRFVDDVEFYFPETQSKNMLIHVRSASRVGYSDFGVNRKRTEDIRYKFATINKE
jgi:uncharacterized protein (DUF1499 family)